MEITIPYKFFPRPYQLNLLKALDSGMKRAVWCAHRRSGKDKVCWNYLIKRAIGEVGTYFYFLPTFSQAKRVVWDNIDNDEFHMLSHIPPEITKQKNKSELSIELINGSVIQLIAADTFEKSNVGTNPKGVVFSEYSISNPNVWNFVRPILLVNGGWAIFNFTPRGMNHAFKLLQIAKENPKEWFYEVLTIEDTGVITKEEYEGEIRQGMPQDLAEQEFYCKFIEGASSVFRKVDEAVRASESDIGLKPFRRYQLGIDLAKHQDYTVITVTDLHTFDIVKQISFNKIDWNEQKEIIVKEVKYWNKGKTWMDSTGIGDPIIDDLKRQGLIIEPFHFTETSREQLLNNLKILLEQNRIKIPNDQELIDQLKSMQYELNGQKVKMKVPEGLHDDRIMSLALSVWGLYEKLPIRDVRELDRQRRKNPQTTGIKLRMTSY
ncbi:MAG: hypothetical protein WC803_12715 [Sphingomonas sp.]|jgi:hypothetical protein